MQADQLVCLPGSVNGLWSERVGLAAALPLGGLWSERVGVAAALPLSGALRTPR